MDSKELWKYLLVIVIAVAAFLHAVYPRYEWRMFGNDGSIVVVYDRWIGSFQRAAWDDQGRIKPMDPFKPF